VTTDSSLRLPALAIRQTPSRSLFAFAIDGKRLDSIADVQRIKRNPSESIIGYQRPEVISHISEIRRYLETENAMLPNAIVIAFDSRVRFEPLGETGSDPRGQLGFVEIPAPSLDSESKPGWIVDGQQRVAALRDADVNSFQVVVIGFVTDSVAEQREQFILVNSTKPLPKGLIYELLPTTEVELPVNLQRKRLPATILERLNVASESPLYRTIQTPTTPGGFVRDNSILRMLENSLNDGALFQFANSRSGAVEIDRMLDLLSAFWHAVIDVFPDAWNKPPTKSRLTHGAGIVTMGHLMDAIVDRLKHRGFPTREDFREDILPLKDFCSWTSGYWHFGPGMQRKWNEIQNTSKDVQLVANYLLVQYKRLVWNADSGNSSSSS
jgi:DGQHR domain-containing protein